MDNRRRQMPIITGQSAYSVWQRNDEVRCQLQPKKIKVNKGIYNRKKHYGNGTRKSVRDAVLKR
ncbi:hypothetical protein [Aeribacillus pallidus]|uniref:hypothetical protein n=1 Tax=Aeribacillus pallidus TaxID=33936 RepID=UPI0012FD0F63|nr:hypothetical protein [Aeribacillus pallidus]